MVHTEPRPTRHSESQITGRVAAPTENEVAAVHIPSKAVGFILGHRGASIQALTEKTGANLRVAAGNEVTTGSGEHRVSSSPAVGVVWFGRKRGRWLCVFVCWPCESSSVV